ncbi:retrovirus-related pol polyprotein from transposon TNT 1-94 [Tanacetum coccineum]
MDVKSVFLYGKIEEEVYVCQPPGFEDPDFPNRVYKVEKAQYGLHQAPKAWYETLSTYLLDNGFQRRKMDKSTEFWSIGVVKTINGEVQLHVLVDGKKIIICEASVRRDLKLEDEEGIDYLLNSTIFEQLALMGKPKRKDTRVPQPSDPSDNVAYEAIYKELDDSLVRAATTASSLEAEQDNDNITKTRSKATPNESSSLGTTSGGGPRCQETMGDTIAQTRFENVSKHSNDSLLTRGNTLQSDKDRLKLNELMELCTTLQFRVLDLEKTKTTQANEIASLKRRVKKLEKKRSSRTHKLKRLYKVGLTARVESSGNKEDLGEDASKQGRRINVIDADKDITLVNVQDDDDNEMFDVDALNDKEVFVARQNENVVEKDDIQAKIDVDHQLAERLQAQEQEELSDSEKATLFQQLLEKRRKHFAAKRAEEKRNKLPTQAQQRKIMCTYLKNMEGKKLKDLKNKSFDSIQKMFDRAFKGVNTFVDSRTDLVEGSSKRVGEELEQDNTKK